MAVTVLTWKQLCREGVCQVNGRKAGVYFEASHQLFSFGEYPDSGYLHLPHSRHSRVAPSCDEHSPVSASLEEYFVCLLSW